MIPGEVMQTIRQFEIIQALATHRHFGRAARALRISQPSLTRSLKEIESRLGVALFDRNGVEPTVFGEMALRHGEPVLANAAQLMREIDLAKGLGSGRLVVCAAMFPTDISARKAIGLLTARYPELSVELIQSDWVRATEMVLKGEADIGVAELTAAETNNELQVEPVRNSLLQFFCAAQHPARQAHDPDRRRSYGLSLGRAELAGAHARLPARWEEVRFLGPCEGPLCAANSGLHFPGHASDRDRGARP